MTGWHDWLERVRTVVFRRREERELEEELRFHLAMEVERQVQAGVPADEARRRSMIALGGVLRTKDEVRDARGTRWLDELAGDIAVAWRGLRRTPPFTIAVVAMLAVGIGANTAIFRLIDAVMVRELPVAHPEELVVIGDPALVSSTGRSFTAQAISYPLYREIRDHPGPLGSVLASGPTRRLDVRVDRSSTELEHPAGRFVSGNYFAVLGIVPSRGRVFGASEDGAPGSSPVAVLSDRYWSGRFHRDPAIVGRVIEVDGASLTVVGIAPPGFDGDVVGAATDLWIPVTMHDVLRPRDPVLDRRAEIWLLLLGRLKPGVTLEQARADLTAFIVRTTAEHLPAADAREYLAADPKVHVGPGNRGLSEVRAAFAVPLVTLMVGVALLLAIICANVANLLLARALNRQKELALRLALGAGRRRLVRGLLLESGLLSGLGAAIGLILAGWTSGILLAMAGDGDAIPLDLSHHGRAFGFAVAAALVTLGLFGLVPAWHASRTDPASMLAGGARTIGAGRSRRRGAWLVGGQVALSVVLLVGTALLGRSLEHVQSTEVGLDREHLLIVNLDVLARGYEGARLGALAERLRDRVAALPGVSDVTYSEDGIFSGTDWSTEIEVPSFTPAHRGDRIARTDNVGPGYVRAIGGHLLAGRDIERADLDRPARVAVVNRSFADWYFAGRTAVGRYFRIHGSIPISIVGVMADVRDHHLTGTPDRRAYYPYVATDPLTSPTELRLAIRTVDDPIRHVAAVRTVVSQIDPWLAVDGIDPVASLMRQSIREKRLLTQLGSTFSLLALLLASAGLYAVMSYSVRRRFGELGLRAALGASRGNQLRLVLANAFSLVTLGLVVGLPLSLAAGRLLRSQLHGVDSVDPLAIAAAVIALGASAALAALVPALSAARVPPLVALRWE